MLVFEDNLFSKIGVRFDKPISDGVDLGGLCKGNGFFCNGMIHMVINSSTDLYLVVFFCINIYFFLFTFILSSL